MTLIHLDHHRVLALFHARVIRRRKRLAYLGWAHDVDRDEIPSRLHAVECEDAVARPPSFLSRIGQVRPGPVMRDWHRKELTPPTGTFGQLTCGEVPGGGAETTLPCRAPDR